MADEPGGWELHRSQEQTRQDMRQGFASLAAKLDRLATAESVADEKAERKAADEKLQQQIDKIGDRSRWWVAQFALPALGLALIAATLVINLVRGTS